MVLRMSLGLKHKTDSEHFHHKVPCFHIYEAASSCRGHRFLTGDQHQLKDGPEII